MSGLLDILFVIVCIGVVLLPWLVADGHLIAQRCRAWFRPNAEDDLATEVVRLLDDDGESWVREPSPFYWTLDLLTDRLRLARGDIRIVASPDCWIYSVLSATVTTARGAVHLNKNNAQRVVDAVSRRKKRIADAVAEDVADEVAA